MILAVDVQYIDDAAYAAGILFSNWTSASIQKIIRKRIESVQAYEPGAFYKRELPCLKAILSDVDLELDVILIDGYVSLGFDAKPGLGRYLFEALNSNVPVIGVAKTRYLNTPSECELIRGISRKPLYITAAGIPLDEAKSLVGSMSGEGRIPDLLTQVDRLARELGG